MDENKNIENNGGYQIEDIIWHQHSNRLMLKILELWPDKTRRIIDLGCGHNFYANTLKLLGYEAEGLDTVPYPGVIKTDITSDELIWPNCGKPINVLSIEVGEHIPADIAPKYLDNICRLGGDVILSWAVLGQEGIGHVNCQSNQWVQKEMLNRGYLFNHTLTLELRESVKDCHCNWLINTLMYFKKIN